ncbi:ATP-binding cassette domain-containing protein [Lachnospiraceae bacterium NSJ-143]|nr:ATP-binding cassette domain-containing protein [Lachnospiraceae bacterium NSJ-143]
MMQVKNLTITNIKDMSLICDDISFSVVNGQRLAVIGEEGNGKSTLLKAIHDIDLIKGYASYSGEIIKNGLKTGLLPQELDYEEHIKSIAEYFCGCDGFFDFTPKELSNAAYGLGLDTGFFYSEEKVGSLSGGEKVKLKILKLIIENPDILLLDEPSNDIDMDTMIYVERFIKNCGKPVIYISHDERLVENTANCILHMERLRRKTIPRATFSGIGYSEYIERRLYGIKRQESNAKKEYSEFKKKEEKFLKIQQKVESSQNRVSRQDPFTAALLKKKMHTVKSMEKRLEKEKSGLLERPDYEEAVNIKFTGNRVPAGKKIVDMYLDSLSVGEKVLSKDIRLLITGSQKVCITGRNGSGKTTLLKAVAAEIKRIRGINTFYMPQDYMEGLENKASAVEYLSENDSDRGRIMSFLGSMNFTADEMRRSIDSLSGGQKAKLFFIKIALNSYDVLILDEPTRNFSAMSNIEIRRVLKEFKGTLICVSHDRKFIDEVCDKVYVLDQNGLTEKYN